MAKMVNINREVEDSFYRYKMPLIQVKVEGRGNGIKTAIPNMVDVAKALGRPPSYPTKYLGVELGAQTQMMADQERYIVNGQFEADRFQDLLDGFIKKFVLCQECGNPETKLRVTSKKLIESSCLACGYRCNLPLTHRLTTYIINNPPNQDAAGKGKKGKKGKGKKGSESSAGGEAEDSKQSMQESQAQQREAGGKIDAPEARNNGDEDDDDDWGEDATEEAARQRAMELSSGVTALTQTDDLEKSTSQRLNMFHAFVEAKLKEPKFPAKEVIGEADRLECKDRGVQVLVQLLWSGGDTVTKMKKHQGLFQRFTFENTKAQKYLLGAFEKLIELESGLLNSTTRLMKTMYDLDIVDEESLLVWGSKVSDKYVSKQLAGQIHAKAKPFLEWLKEADEESSGEDEDVGFGDVSTETPAATAGKGPAKEEATTAGGDDNEEDIDIDDI